MADELRPIGVALLLALGADLRPPCPERGLPGLICIAENHSGHTVHVRPKGFDDNRQLEQDMLLAARQVLEGCDLQVIYAGSNQIYRPGLAVTRKLR